MAAPTIQVSEGSREALQTLAEQTGQTMIEVVDKAVEAYRRELFFEQMNAGYAELRSNPAAWAEHLAQHQELDSTLPAGLDSTSRGPRAPAVDTRSSATARADRER